MTTEDKDHHVICKGKNCNAVNGRMHSRECRDEHDNAVHYGAGNRHPEARYAGYKGRPLSGKYSPDELAAWKEGHNAREDSTEKMPDKLHLDLHNAIAHGMAMTTADKDDITDTIENIMPIFQAELDRRVAEAEERQRKILAVRVEALANGNPVSDWGKGYAAAIYNALTMILNAGVKDDE